MRADHLSIVAGTPVAAGALYLLLAGEVSRAEAVACAAVVVLACGYALALAKTASLQMRLPWRAISALVCGAWAVVPDTVRVGRALVAAFRGGEGSVRRQPFRYGGRDPADAGRRATVVISLSLSPNGFVLGADEYGSLVLHQLRAAACSDDREWPV